MTYLGFDYHKRWTQATAIDDRGKILREGRVLNDSGSLRGFLRGLPKPWKGVVEAGPTWGWIYDTLSQLGVKMVVAHPRQVRAIAEAKIKTDKIDARMLASLLRVGLIPEVYVPSEQVRAQKMLWRERIWLVRMLVRLKNRIHRLLTHYHVTVPEFSDLFGAGGRRFLEGLELPEPGNRILKAQLKLLESYRSQIQEVQRWAMEATENHPYRDYLESLPGFGKVFAPIVALEIDDPKRFANPGKLASYCGLVPSLYSSGGKSWQGGIGREGNHWLKWAFIEAAWAAIRTSPYFRLLYQRLRQRKTAQVAIVACARRLSEIAFHLMKERRCYEERTLSYA
jgi:transposase